MPIPRADIRPLQEVEKQRIAKALRNCVPISDLAYEYRVPRAWVQRIADAIKRTEQMAQRQKQQRAIVQSSVSNSIAKAKRIEPVPETAPRMTDIISKTRVQIMKVGE